MEQEQLFNPEMIQKYKMDFIRDFGLSEAVMDGIIVDTTAIPFVILYEKEFWFYHDKWSWMPVFKLSSGYWRKVS